MVILTDADYNLTASWYQDYNALNDALSIGSILIAVLLPVFIHG